MNGTQQSPIDFQSSWGVARKHAPKFNYPSGLKGTINNWDFGPQWAYDKNASNGEEPTMEFEENGKVEKVFFKSWHTHAPAEHKIDGYAPRAEIHFVHYDDKDVPRAVVGFFIDRLADAESDFFGSLPTYPTIFHNVTQENVPLDLNLAIQEAAGYRNYFTYQGSLTTPPCTEGLRWYISKDIIYVSDEQLQEILTASTFSARPVNPIWLHNVNG
jgi:carbonic anhydrase